MIKRFEDLEKKLKNQTNKPRIGVVCAHDLHTVEAIKSAVEKDLIEAVLIGIKKDISKILLKLDFNNPNLRIVDSDTDAESAVLGVKLVRAGEIDLLMKGKIQTKDFLKAVVNSDTGIKNSDVLSHIAINELANYHKIIAITDGGMVAYPDVKQKRAILQNAVELFNNLGYEKPKVAILAAVEVVNPKMQETIDADEIKKMNLPNCIVEGPISYDLTFSKESAEIKGYKSEVTADVDILVMPNIATGNIVNKALIYSAGAKMAGIVVGAKVPIVLTSRGASSEEKYYSVLLAALCNSKGETT